MDLARHAAFKGPLILLASLFKPPQPRIGLLILLFVFLPFLGIQLEQSEAQVAVRKSAEEHLNQGQGYYQRGVFGEAAVHWMEAARLYEEAAQLKQQSLALLYLSQALQHLGQTRKSVQTLEIARDLANRVEDTGLVTRILGRLGHIYLRLGRENEALAIVNQGLELARIENRSAEVAILLNETGNILTALGNYAAAIGAYTESTALAMGTGNSTLMMVARINAARTKMEQGRYANSEDQLDLMASDMPSIPDSHEKIYGFLRIGLIYEALRSHLMKKDQQPPQSGAGPTSTQRASRGIETRPVDEESELSGASVEPGETPKPEKKHFAESEEIPQSLLTKAASAFQSAIDLATRLDDSLAKSYGWGYLGHLYEQEKQWEEALTLTRRAIQSVQEVHAPESLYRWHWQAARVHLALGQVTEAKNGYQRAISTLEPIRQELSIGLAGRKRPFRQTVGPLFFELADLLLQEATANPERTKVEGFLHQAQNTVEGFKAAELQDYFQDECVQAAQDIGTTLSGISRKTAVVYPIVLPDRLELLMGLPSGLKQFVVQVSETMLTQEIRAFRRNLERRPSEYLSHAQRLYDWLIRPFEADLTAEQVDTIVFVPDGPLRTIPLAPLHNGEQFLIERYALATTPGLTLTNPQALDRTNIKMLAFGLTESTQDFPPLPNVGAELEAIQTVYGGKTLVNQDFLIQKVEQELKNQAYNIVHIASHGKVEQKVEDTFVLAFDGKITMNRLAELIGVFKFRETPLELLTLSACQTAAGDDQAALGLAGVAVKAGAQSALATLWFIDDEATSKLVPEFYRQLKENPTISKAVALQRAQIKFLKNPEYTHPSYWASFLLINNWL